MTGRLASGRSLRWALGSPHVRGNRKHLPAGKWMVWGRRVISHGAATLYDLHKSKRPNAERRLRTR